MLWRVLLIALAIGWAGIQPAHALWQGYFTHHATAYEACADYAMDDAGAPVLDMVRHPTAVQYDCKYMKGAAVVSQH